MTLDLSSLTKAVISLEKTAQVALSPEKNQSLDTDQKNAIRAGVIQNFEFTYELCWKFMQRWLNENQPQEETSSARTKKDLFRLAARYGLIQDPIPWFEYSDARNLTAHTYSEDKAKIVFEHSIRFAAEARALLAKFEKLS